MHKFSVGLSVVVLGLSGCAPAPIDKLMFKYGMTPLEMPSTLYDVGTVLYLENPEDKVRVGIVDLCSSGDKIGAGTVSKDVHYSESRTEMVIEVKKRSVEGNLSASADMTEKFSAALSASGNKVKNVSMSIDNATIRHSSVGQLIEIKKILYASALNCKDAILEAEKNGAQIQQISDTFIADATYKVEFDSSFDFEAAVKADPNLVKGIEGSVGGGIKYTGSGSEFRGGKGLFYGIKFFPRHSG